MWAQSTPTRGQAISQHPTRYVSPFPDQGSLYLLVAGILLGVLMGPAVLGRLAPSIYEDAFVGGADLARQLREDQALTQEQAETLDQIGVTDAAIPEQILQRQQQEVVLQAQLQQAKREHHASLTGWTTALMLAVIAVMMLEALLGPETKAGTPTQVSPSLGRLVAARYALTAVWIAIVIAQPQLLAALPIVFAGLLIVVALGVALVPLGPKGSRPG